MSNNTGVFGLSGYNDKNLEGLIPDKTRESYREYGYFSTGPTNRVDFSNDTSTALQRGSLNFSSPRLTATSNSNYGWFGGGSQSGISRTRVERIDFSNDNATASIRGPLTIPRLSIGSNGNSNYGWFAAGRNLPGEGSLRFSRIDRIDYANDLSTASIRSNLNSNDDGVGFNSNSNFGYISGGSASIFKSKIERLNYSNDLSNLSLRGPLSSAKSYLSSTGNSNFGYIGGGFINAPLPTAPISTIERIDYANDTATASVRGPLSLARNRIGATGNSNFGYFGGGFPGPLSTVDRIDYSNDTQIASVRGPLIGANYSLGACSSASFGGSPISQYGVFAKPFGYFGGGSVGPVERSTIDRVDYSNDTSGLSARGSLATATFGLNATGNSNFGYFAGGRTPTSPTTLTSIQRIDYTNDINQTLSRGNLVNTTFYVAGATSTNNFGYFGGGYFPSTYSTVERLNYSNDSSNTSVRGSLSYARGQFSATGNSNFGYYIGGAANSTIDRINYSNDTATALSRSNLQVTRILHSSTGNNNFAYAAGGNSPSPAALSSIERLDYSSDTTAASVRSNLSSPRQRIGATGNSNFGYFSGGGTPSPGEFSTVDRVDYSNDTSTATTRSPLTVARLNFNGVSPTSFGGATDFKPTQQFFDIQSMRRIEDTTIASVKKRALGSYGYFGGGYAFRTDVYRLDFSNDTAGISRRGNLESGRRWHTSFANRNYGYQTRGSGGGSPNRVDYSNDNAIALLRSGQSQPTTFYGSSISTNNEFAFTISSGQSTLYRIDYSNDNQTLARGKLVFSINRSSGVGKKSFGYVAGGGTTRVQRLEYANDNCSSVNRGSLEIPTNWISAQLGNDNFGYFVGGGSQVQRVEYANDLVRASIRGPLSSSAYARTGTGNFEFGWVGFNTPANTPGPGSQVQRIDYSNDLVSPQIRTNGSGIIYSVGMGNAKF